MRITLPTPLALPFAVLLSLSASFAGAQESNSPNLGSRFVRHHLNSEQCRLLVGSAVQANLDSPASRPELRKMLQVLAAECGVGEDPADLNNITPQIWKLDGTDLAIHFDGQAVLFGPGVLGEIDCQTLAPSTPITTITAQQVEVLKTVPVPEQGLVAHIQQKFSQLKESGQGILANGKLIGFVSGIAWHNPSRYQDRAELNEKAWGAGIGREVVDAIGDVRSISVLAFLDSHAQWEPSIAYIWQRPFQITNGVTVLAGYSAGLTSRADVYNRVPVPYIFPELSLKIGKMRLNATIIPPLASVGGDVVYFNMIYDLEDQATTW